MRANDKALHKIQEAYSSLDWTQPGAHTVYHELSEITESVVVDLDHTTDRECYFYEVGVAKGLALANFKTIPPINDNKASSEVKP